MPAPTVFISYSHRDEDWKDRLVTHLGVLANEGIVDVWDDRRIEAGDDWQPEIEAAIDKAAIAVLLISANFLTSKFILGEEVPKLLKRRTEQGVRVIPLIVKPCAWTQVKWLSPIQARPKDGKPLSAGSEYQIDADLAALAAEIAAIVRRAEKKTSEASETTSAVWKIPPEKVSLAKLPSTSSILFGRERELKMFDDVWNNQDVNVVSLVAWGGVGKTALVNKWLLGMAQDNYRGAERVYGWSFYSQGAAEERQVSADQFIAAALTWFGDPDPTLGSPWDKGERLAELVRRQRTLLILDGLEPLQNPPPIETGKIRDPGLTSLLRELAVQNPGLIIITTRLPVDDLKQYVVASPEGAKQSPREPEIAFQRLAMAGLVLEIDLENLSPQAGAAYLKHLGVDGTDEEREETSEEFAGHALALTLMGSYLNVVHRGDIRKRKEISHVFDEQKQGAHARRVMESYERWLRGKPELDILRVMGLFDRPAEQGALDVLRKRPATKGVLGIIKNLKNTDVIKGLTDNIQNLSDHEWKYAVNNLRRLRLLAEADPYEPETLDCHPLLREHFGEKLKLQNPDAWREGNSRLYEHYKSTAKEYPETLQEMVPLYAAVLHGCQAGRHQEALREVYWRRIQRGNESFNTKKLGAIGSELAALSSFFDPPWHKPVDRLREDWKGFVLTEAGFNLRALGRLAEATEPLLAGQQNNIARKDWKNAAIQASNLSELYLTLGDLPQAFASAEQSVQLADRSGEWEQRMINRTTLADVFHQAGRLAEAQAAFREAEQIQKERQPELSFLYSLRGYQYCDLLLSQGDYADVERRASKSLEWAMQYLQSAGGSLLWIALDNLSLGRAGLLQSQHDPNHPITNSLVFFNHAVDGLRQSGRGDILPLGLLARAEYYRLTGGFDRAKRDLDEAFTIATRGGMGLHLADCHLEYARLYLAKGEKEKAKEHWETAKDMIEKMGYHRRDKEVEELGEQLMSL